MNNEEKNPLQNDETVENSSPVTENSAQANSGGFIGWWNSLAGGVKIAVIAGIACLLIAVVVLVALSIVLSPFEGQMLTDSREFDDSLWTLLTVVVAAPIFEEIIFRGKLYNVLHVSCAPILAVLLSSAVFGIVHFQPIVFISGILSGVLFRYAYIRTRSIYSPILLHMCNNALAYALTILSYSERSLLDLVESDAYNFIIYYVSSIILVVSMIAMVIRIARSR
jgi:membrane protease YdiL (CAAX protease family)